MVSIDDKDKFEQKEMKKIRSTKNKLSKPKTRNIRFFFLLKKKRKETKDRIIRDIWTLFETQEEKKERKN